MGFTPGDLPTPIIIDTLGHLLPSRQPFAEDGGAPARSFADPSSEWDHRRVNLSRYPLIG